MRIKKDFSHVTTVDAAADEILKMMSQAERTARRRGQTLPAALADIKHTAQLATIAQASSEHYEILLSAIDSDQREVSQEVKAGAADSINEIFDSLAARIKELDLPGANGLILEAALNAAKEKLIKELT